MESPKNKTRTSRDRILNKIQMYINYKKRKEKKKF